MALDFTRVARDLYCPRNGYSGGHFETCKPEAKVTIMKYMVVIEKGERGYGAHVPDLPGCMAAGETWDEVVSLIKEAIEFHIEGLKEYGEPVPYPSSVVEYIEVNAA